jgi:membrane-associated phospholipid phosphatase
VDPFNSDQKFYGVNWARVPTLLPGLPIAALGPGDPPAERDRDYIRDLEEVRALGAFRPQGPTDQQVKSGLFWAYDGSRLIGTPPRLYNQILVQIAKSDGFSPPQMARLLALCNIAMADAAIVCWEAKYRYKVWRPVLGVRNALHHPDPHWRPFGSPRTNPAQFALGPDARRLTALSMLGGGERNWFDEAAKNVLPYNRACFTPNFPSYPSGHATFGSACFNMLKRVRSERDPTRQDPGRIDGAGPFISDELNGLSIDNFRNVSRPYLPVRYTRIEQMIDDNNKSRVYLGVHWNFDCEFGSRSGARVADAVYPNAYRRRHQPGRDGNPIVRK